MSPLGLPPPTTSTETWNGYVTWVARFTESTLLQSLERGHRGLFVNKG
jgi:hypothetical protein